MKIDFEDLRRFCVTVLFYCAGKFEPSSEPIRFRLALIILVFTRVKEISLLNFEFPLFLTLLDLYSDWTLKLIWFGFTKLDTKLSLINIISEFVVANN